MSGTVLPGKQVDQGETGGDESVYLWGAYGWETEVSKVSKTYEGRKTQRHADSNEPMRSCG